MNEQPYPLVTELLYRAKNYSIEALSISPIFELWRIESLDIDIVMAQLKSGLESDSLSAADKLKLGFLIGYSWPLHYHPRTEELLLLAKTHIHENYVAESMLLWGKLASFLFRDNQLKRALDEITLAFKWAKHRANARDIVPFMHWSTLIFVRLNRPQDIATLAKAILTFSDAEEDSHYRQCSELSLAMSLLDEGLLDKSHSLLEHTCNRINAGTSRLCTWNQAGAVHCLAKIAYKKNDLQSAEKLSSLSMELNENDQHEILKARSKVLRYKLARVNNASQSASALLEDLAYYQDNLADDIDIKLNDDITRIRLAEQKEPQPTVLDDSTAYEIEPEILKLQQSFREYMHACMYPPNQA